MAGQSGSYRSSFHWQPTSAEAQSNGGCKFTTNPDGRTTPAGTFTSVLKPLDRSMVGVGTRETITSGFAGRLDGWAEKQLRF
jgi:hypothetical protein